MLYPVRFPILRSPTAPGLTFEGDSDKEISLWGLALLSRGLKAKSNSPCNFEESSYGRPHIFTSAIYADCITFSIDGAIIICYWTKLMFLQTEMDYFLSKSLSKYLSWAKLVLKNDLLIYFFSFLWHKILVLIINTSMFLYEKVGHSKLVEMHWDVSQIPFKILNGCDRYQHFHKWHW
jgi:hypothetical protein